jgi:hypothetical protein
MANKVIKLVTAQTRDLLPLETRTAGTYLVDLLIEGNSLLSTVFVKSIAGTVKVNYHESTTGRDDGERKELQGHPLISAANTLNPSKLTITPFHNSPQLEVIVTGTAEFSVFGTVVNSFATDLDAALIFDGDPFVIDENKAIPIGCLDEDSGQLFFLRCKDGAIITDPINGGDPKFLDGLTLTTPGVEQTLATDIVTAGKTRLLSSIKVSCFQSGTWIARMDSDIIGSGRTSSGQPDSFFQALPRRTLTALSTFTLKFTSRTGGPASDVTYHVMATEI